MNWDDLRFVLVLSKAGALARAARALSVDHTTVGRRIEAAEAALGVRLFTRTASGYVPTAEAERLLGPMRQVEEAALAVERAAAADRDSLTGTVRVTSPETFGISYLAPRLAALGLRHPGLTLDLVPSGEVLDLGRRQAEIAVRFFRSRHENLVLRRAGDVAHGFYATPEYLARRPVRGPADLREQRILSAPLDPDALETRWLKRLGVSVQPSFVSLLSLALLGAARASAGLAILPRYLGDAEPRLRHVPMPDEPTEPIWLTVHRDLKKTPRVRAVLDFLLESLEEDAELLTGNRRALPAHP
jgi:DNA-binding transcriptional LysR family regulator